MSDKTQIPPYDAKSIEAKWQKRWAETKAFAAKDTPDPAKKYYVLEMFPYPSGDLHMGHVRNYAIGDLIARFKRLQGLEVLHPMGWDAFGLPAENAAIKEKIHPSVRTPQNIASVKKQMQMLGLAYDWDREIGTYLPEYYKWNQWFFLKFHEKGLIYRRESEVNWCPSCLTVLANEQVVEGKCWRCDSIVEKKKLPEWAFRITAYAEQLLAGVDELVAGGWPDRVTTMQRNWIGKSTGLECDFPVDGSGEKIRIFTTRADTIFGATYVVVAPEHPIVAKVTTPAQKSAVEAFAERMRKTDRIARTAEGTAKEGVDTGARAVNPFTKEKIPVYVANFVLADYGTGAVMSVPAHDQRDFEFAKKHGLPVRVVIGSPNAMPPHVDAMEEAFTEDGILIASGEFSGKDSETARTKIAEMAERGGFGTKSVKWHLRDWGFSRQRYWGTPIPVVYCEKKCDGKDGMQLVAEKDLPVKLPMDVQLTGEAGAPLARVPEFLKAVCPKCGGAARREAETMDTFVDSTWYFARFLDPKNDRVPFRREIADAWLPIDLYIGGPEHAVLHLMYFRFWTMVMKDLGLVKHGEPARRLLTQGMVVSSAWRCPNTASCPDAGYLPKAKVDFDEAKPRCRTCKTEVVVTLEKMSKNKKNGVSPEYMVDTYGADTARVFSLFAAPPEKDLDWKDDSVPGSFRFLRDVWNLTQESLPQVKDAPVFDPSALASANLPATTAAWRKTHATIKRVTEAVADQFHYNVGVSAMMELKNALQEIPAGEREAPQGRAALRWSIERLLQILNPYAPHLAAELWETLGNGDIQKAGWPKHDPAALVADTVLVVVQVNGKKRGDVTVPAGATQADVEAAAKAETNVKAHLEGKQIAKVIYPKKDLINFVVKGSGGPEAPQGEPAASAKREPGRKG